MMHRGVSARWQQVDLLLLLAAAGLSAFGVALVTSATWQYSDHPSLLGNTWFLKQAAFTAMGFAAMIGCASLHPRLIRELAFPAYGFCLLLLVAAVVLGHGAAEYGAQRWIDLGFFQLQPSEPTKLALILVLARVLGGDAPGGRALALSALFTVIPVLLIYLQPDLGTALSILAIWFGCLVLAGLPRKYVVGIVALGIIGTPVIWLGLKDYMRQRVLTFLNPAADALGEGYNILQAQISIGSGGMLGKGLMEGSQTQLRFLRVSQSDFIFSVLGEELGFVGAMALFALFLILLFRILRAYEIANDRFSSILCAGVGSMIAFQTIANIGSNVGLTPVVGIPLPFVSHGGSALITQLAALGLVQATLLRRRRYRFEA